MFQEWGTLDIWMITKRTKSVGCVSWNPFFNASVAKSVSTWCNFWICESIGADWAWQRLEEWLDGNCLALGLVEEWRHLIKTFIWNFYLELSLAQKFPIIFQFFYIILSSEGGDDEKRISTGQKYNPAFFKYIYWIVTFVKLNRLWGRKSMGESSFYLLRLLGV